MWIAEIKPRGCFEAEGLMELMQQMVDHYAEDEDSMPDIESLCWISNSGMECRASAKAVDYFESQCVDGINYMRIETEYERQHERELRSSYYRSVL